MYVYVQYTNIWKYIWYTKNDKTIISGPHSHVSQPLKQGSISVYVSLMGIMALSGCKREFLSLPTCYRGLGIWDPMYQACYQSL